MWISLVVIDLRSRLLRDLLDPVVDVVVCPFVGFVDLIAHVLWIQVQFAILLWQQRIEFGVQHANYLAAFVAHDRVELLVPDYRDGVAPAVVLVGFEVELGQVFEGWVQGVGRDVFAGFIFGGGGETPAF